VDLPAGGPDPADRRSLLAFGLPESPRWLEGRGWVSDARKVLEHIERLSARGGRVLPEPDLAGHSVVSSEKVRVRELLGSVYGRRAILLLACWTLIYAGCVCGFAELPAAAPPCCWP
jgi:hypothetical protein